jgi:hypothetical protein
MAQGEIAMALTLLCFVASSSSSSSAALGPWNELDTCHKPADEGCAVCGAPNPAGAPGGSGFNWQRSTNNCTGCFPGAPCEPGNCPCGDCAPGFPPWYNDVGFSAAAPAGCTKPCSNCTVMLVKNYIEAMYNVPDDGPCKCDDSAPPPQARGCDCGLPGVHCCKCHCHIRAQIKGLCGLDPAPAKFPGPCAFDELYSTSRGLNFTGECDADGYYNTMCCGPVAPPPLPPSPPWPGSPAGGAPLPQLQARRDGPSGQRDSDREPQYCWCVEPTFGIQNGTASWRQGATPVACHDTVQCDLLNKPACASHSAFCNWEKRGGAGGLPESFGCYDLQPPN